MVRLALFPRTLYLFPSVPRTSPTGPVSIGRSALFFRQARRPSCRIGPGAWGSCRASGSPLRDRQTAAGEIEIVGGGNIVGGVPEQESGRRGVDASGPLSAAKTLLIV